MIERVASTVLASDELSLPVALGAVIALLIALVALLVWLAGGSRHRPASSRGRHRAQRNGEATAPERRPTGQ